MKISSDVEFVDLLQELTGFKHALNPKFLSLLKQTVENLGAVEIKKSSTEPKFWRLVNERLQLNQSALAEVYFWLAQNRASLNFRDKKTLEASLNENDLATANKFLKSKFPNLTCEVSFLASMGFRNFEESRQELAKEFVSPSKLRKLEGRDVGSDISQSLAAYLLWSCWDVESLYAYFSGSELRATGYTDFISKLNPELFQRKRSLVVRQIQTAPADNSNTFSHADWIKNEWDALDNHGFLVCFIPIAKNGESDAWNWVEMAKVYAERFNEVAIKNAFFKKNEIRKQSEGHYGVSLDSARWDLASEGFTYKDTFVIQNEDDSVDSLVVVFQKNEREATLLNCPGCRSTNVQGNSYQTLGVKSWECNNLLCLDRSIYNRGRRYQLRSIIYQSAFENPENEIPQEFISFLQKDVVKNKGISYLVEALIRHYSMIGDVVALVDFDELDSLEIQRKILVEVSPPDSPTDLLSLEFFKKILRSKSQSNQSDGSLEMCQEVIHGEASSVLSRVPNESIGRSITSPPYYNARDYSTWPNLYCYLSDMANIARGVFDALKPGGFFVYNIFDYFDNDRTIVFSDMGKRRISLASPTVALFKEIGFEFVACSVWNKGDIQGNRGFNGGNRTPFYQAPFNCWEHVLVFKKPGDSVVSPTWNTVLRIPPVVKIIKGENTYGHTAPYPEALVEPFLINLERNEIVLDPFAGSSTTAVAAIRSGLRPLMIEMHENYVRLSEKRIRDTREDLENRIL